MKGFGYTRLETEEKLIADYEKAAAFEREARIEERELILTSLGRFHLLSADTIRRLSTEPDEDVIDSLIRKIIWSDEDTGLAMLDERLFSDHPESVIHLCGIRSSKVKEKYYRRGLEILYDPEKSIRPIRAITGRGEVPCAEILLYFLGECSCRSAKDIIPYAESSRNPDECRGTAAYVICNCPDVSKYQEAVARLMHSSVYKVAFNAMQGAMRASLKDPVIMNAFRWMKVYYKDDKTIQSNLERVEGL